MEKKVRPEAEQRNRMRRQSQKRTKKRRQRSLTIRVILLFVIIIGVIGGTFFVKRYGPTKERADLKEYYGIEHEDQLAIVIDNKVVGNQGILIDGKPYVEYAVVRDYLNKRFYLDRNENILLYTLPEGTIKVDVGSTEYMLQKQRQNEGYVIMKMNGDMTYISLEFVQKYTNMEFRTYQEPDRVVIDREWGEKKLATVKKDTQVRYRGGVKSPILGEISRKDVVTVIENEGDWKKVRTKDGFIGYVKKSCLKNERVETVSRAFEEQIYPNISKNYTINLAWHVVTNKTANNYVLETIANTRELTTLSPTWFTVADTDGNIRSLASEKYVNYAHQSDIEVWALVRDFDGGISSYEESYELLSHTSSRENLINQLMAEVLKNDIDGINLDFEKISTECGEHYIQFVRELSLKCRQNDIILSIDNYVPKPYNSHYDLEEQGIMADYVVIMGYDEHYSGSYESGPVASLSFAKQGIEDTLKVVPKEKVISGVPFFTRLWKEVPKTESELAAQEGTEAAEYPMKVTSTAYGMSAAEDVIANAGAEIVVDETTGQNYAEWTEGNATYKIWLEDETALERKLELIKRYDLAGNAAWRLGFEKTSTWDLILKYVN